MNDTTPTSSTTEISVITCEDAAAWHAWLADHHERQAGVWLKIARKASGIPSVTIHEALDGALCYGWIDGQRKAHDDTHYLQKYTPRRPRSAWSMVNVRKVEVLIAAGRMQPAGFAEIERAKADGRWDAAYASQREATVPADLEEALLQNDRARAAFASLNKTDRYQVILQLLLARTPGTRAARLRRAITSLESG